MSKKTSFERYKYLEPQSELNFIILAFKAKFIADFINRNKYQVVKYLETLFSKWVYRQKSIKEN